MNFNKERMERLRKAYLKAMNLHKKIFTFDKKKFDTRYAGYLLIYLEEKINEKEKEQKESAVDL